MAYYSDDDLGPSAARRLADDLVSAERQAIGSQRGFWPFSVLRGILTEDKILHVLKEWEYESPRAFHHARLIRDQFLRIFAILLLNDRPKRIVDFIENHVDDEHLPLLKEVLPDPRLEDGYVRRHPDLEISALRLRDGPFDFIRKWRLTHIYNFYHTQWQFLTPKFTYQDVPIHYRFESETILPWIDVKQAEDGAFATVQRVTIDPDSCDFASLKEGMSTHDFAIKSLHRQNKDDFARELSALKRLANTADQHVIRLLCSFEHDEKLCLMFPWAESNLRDYLSFRPGAFATTGNNIKELRWVSNQLRGLAGALREIHQPSVVSQTDDVVYARHGDIKPENILWFGAANDGLGQLVYSDFGLARIHTSRTRSRNERTKMLGFTVTYRPPEIEMREGIVSRSADVWSLGCVFLEMACWILGGPEEVSRLSSEVASSSIGADDGGFFSLKLTESGEYEYSIKATVNKFVDNLRSNPRCTQFIQDFLDLIQFQMLVVTAAGRITSEALAERLDLMNRRVMDDADPDYIRQGGQPERQHEIDQPRPLIVPETNFNPDVRNLIKENRIRMTERFTLRTTGTPRRSIRVTERSIRAPAALVETKPTETKPEGDSISNIWFTDVIDINVSYSIGIVSPEADLKFHKVAFDVTWQLQECIRRELDGNVNLSPVLTVTGKFNAWATTCHEYVSTTWGQLGEQFLVDLEVLLGKSLDASGQQSTVRVKGSLCSPDQEATATSRIEFQGTRAEISTLAQFLCWIAATFRLPRPGEVSCSPIHFDRAHTPEEDCLSFTIALGDLFPLKDMPGTCWAPLFPSTVVAVGFPVSTYPGARGLRIPFDAMLEMANILYDVALEDDDGKDAGVYFDGISYSLYPTAYFEDQKVVQWHLVSKSASLEDDNDHSMAPDSGTRPRWKRISSPEILVTSTAILGYCSNVQIQLGTAARAEYHRSIKSSLSIVERPPPEIAGGSATLGFNILKIFTLSTTATWKPRNGLQSSRKAKELSDYVALLDSAKNEVVILCDTADGKEGAWMVPELSLILELFNIWAMNRGLNNIQYAEPGPDGGAEARKVLAGDFKYSQRTAVTKVLESDKDKQIGNIIQQIWGSIQKAKIENAKSDVRSRGILPLGQTGLTGWDWLELANLALPTSLKRELGPRPIPRVGKNLREARKLAGGTPDPKQQPSWMPLAEQVPVFFGRDLGELITPTPSSQICRQWSPMPTGLNDIYLTASVHCIQALGERFDEQQRQCWVFREWMWEFKSVDIFQPCADCMNNPAVCIKQPQVLTRKYEKVVNKLWKAPPAQAAPARQQPAPAQPVQPGQFQIAGDGAVVFSLQRKQISMG